MTNGLNKSLEVGMVLNDKWVILEFIAEGGMGEVYRAHQINLKRDVAVKVISREWLESCSDNEEERETGLQRFRNEVQAMAQIRHPNVLQIFDYGSASVNIGGEDVSLEYIVMEYVPGGTLRSTMSEEGFDSEEELISEWLRHYFFPVLDGVQAMHDLKMAHRDLKPGNVLMDGNTPKIADFGLAHSHQWKPVTQSIDIKGTPQYMSQEHFFEFKKADHRADIYSMGKILYESIAGRINSKTIPFKKAALANPDTPFLKKLDQIIQDATAEDKEKRTASVKDFRNELQNAINITQGEKPKNASTPLEFKSIFAHPKWIWAGIIVATLSVLLMTIWHLMGEPGMRSSKTGLSVTSHKEMVDVLTVNNEKRLKLDSATNSFVSEHLGKQHLIPGGQLVLPATVEEHSGKSISVAPLYMDEFMVTNQQYVEFLNHNLSRISLENGVVKGDGANWFLLGEVYEGYDPIVYRNEKFHVSDPSYTSSPVLRVSGHGASAFARFFGRRLPTEAELLYAMVKGTKAPQPSQENTSNRSNRMNMEGMMHEMGGGMMEQYNHTEKSTANTIGRTSKEPPPATFYDQNAFGIRGLNERIGEWVIRAFPSPSKTKSQSNMFAVIGGLENQFNDSSSIPSIISRFPWEGFEEVGFRTVKSSLIGNQ